MGITIADVAGKGVPAALLMSNLQAAVRAFAQDGAAPSAVCASVNRLLCRNIASGRFVTFCYAYIDPSRRKLTYANAGHNPQLVVRPGGAVDTLVPGGTVVGVVAESAYEQGVLALAPGDRLVFYTDGITEGRNPAGEEFGEDQLAAAAIRHRALEAGDMLAALLQDVERFNAGAYEDDATLIVGEL